MFSLPFGMKAKAKIVHFDGLIRPKVFIKLELFDGESKSVWYRYVNAGPKLLRLRLFIAMLKLKGSVRKFGKFKHNWKVSDE